MCLKCLSLFYKLQNDSGWDNASIFHEGLPVSYPDLLVFIVEQLDILSRFAQLLGLNRESQRFKKLMDNYYEALMTKYFNGEQFIAFNALTGKEIKAKSSALLFMPLILADRMASNVSESLVN